jgi:hypothetical protein
VVTAGAVSPIAVTNADGSTPIGLIAAAGLLTVALLAALAWRSLRREQRADEFAE